MRRPLRNGPIAPRPVAARAVAVSIALVADRVLGEPPAPVHPVARFGQAMGRLEGPLWADRRRAGVAYTLVGVGTAAAAGALLSRAPGAARLAALAGAVYVAVAGRALCEAAEEVARALDGGDLETARRLLRGLVGRETVHLDEAEVARATVESVAENTVDAVTAPLLWALAGGAPGVLAYRAVNTLDAMVGHKSPRYQSFGWASARADDAANWVPARMTAVLIAAVRPVRASAVLHAVRTQAPAHPSPNAGVIESAFAAALGVSLGGTNDYGGRVEVRPPLGAGPAPSRQHIHQACRLSREVSLAFGVTVSAAAALNALRPASRRPG